MVAEAASADDLLVALRETRTDVVVMDMNMPGPGGLDLVKQATAPMRKIVRSIDMSAPIPSDFGYMARFEGVWHALKSRPEYPAAAVVAQQSSR